MKTSLLSFKSTQGEQRLDVSVASSMLSRMRGLLGRPALEGYQGMLLRSCNLVHTFGMRYPIDMVFMRRDGHVLKVSTAVAPRRAQGHMRAHCVLELASGAAKKCGIHPGMRLPIEIL